MINLLKWLLLAILFAPAILFAFRQKKWYLFLGCAFIGILPDNFAIELSSALPLLSAQRILILIIFGFWLVRKWKERKWFIPMSLVIYLGVHVVISVANLHWGLAGEIKRVAIMLLEQVLLVVMLVDLIEDRQELDQCVDAMILAGCALSVIGVLQTIANFDLASVMHIVDPRVSLGLTQRMEMTRAFGTTNAIMFGCYCTFMALLIYYRLERTGKLRYSLALALDVLALMCTMSRSAWLCFGGIAVVFFIVRPRKFARRILISLAMIVVLFCAMLPLNAGFGGAVLETGKSTLNTVLSAANIHLPGLEGSASTPDPDDPSEPTEPTEEGPQFEISEKFGLNANSAANSRLVEWTAFLYMMEEGTWLFGYGYSPFPRQMLHYFYPQFGFWTTASTLDVGLLAFAAEGGIIGLLTELALMGWILVTAFLNRGKRGKFTFNKLVVFLIPAYLLLNFMAAFSGPIWVVYGLYYAGRRLERKGLADAGEPAPYGKWVF